MIEQHLYSVSNGFTGYGPVTVLVMAENEADAIQRAVPVFTEDNQRAIVQQAAEYADPAKMTARLVELPYIGDTLP